MSKEIPGFEGCYAANEKGEIISLVKKQGTRPGRVLKPTLNKNGYLYYLLCVDYKKTGHTGHSLVAAAFYGPRPKGMDVMHINHDRKDNRPANLKYGSRSENVLASVEAGNYRWVNHVKNLST